MATERAILETVLYSDLFDYPLTPSEIAYFLIGESSDPRRVRAGLRASPWLKGQITLVDGFVTVKGREGLVERRRQREECSRRLWPRARIFAGLLSCLPFVRMIGVTGALAMDNSDERDDVDVLIVTAPERVWITRALSLLVVCVGRLRRNTLCPNYVLSETILPLQRRSLYIAHEFVQMVPLYGCDVYERMRAANRWTEQYLPNATRPFRSVPEHRPGPLGRGVKHVLELLLGGRLGNRIEEWEMKRKLRKFRHKLQSSRGAAILTRDQVKGHFDDHGEQISQALLRKLKEFRLEGWETTNEPPPLAGSGEPEPAYTKGA